MRRLTNTTDPAAFIGGYGRSWRSGLLSEHLHLFVRAGGTHRLPSRSNGAGWAIIDGRAYPVVCSELVWIDTEDGRIDGRCGANAMAETGTCEGHDPR